jgi:hypothetical protein
LDEKKIDNCFNILKTSSPSNKHVSLERERERYEIERFEREQS